MGGGGLINCTLCAINPATVKVIEQTMSVVLIPIIIKNKDLA